MKKVIEVNNISYTYVKDKEIFENIHFSVTAGEFVGLLGKNGSGKTSIIEMLIGFRTPDSGTIKIFNELTNSKVRQYIKSVAFVSHDIQINPEIKIADFFDHHKYFFKSYSDQIEKETCEILKIDPAKKVGELSTGQKKKVQITTALASNAPLIIVDEVTAVLDPSSREQFLDLLTSHNQNYKKTILLATNIVDDLKNHCNKIIFLEHNAAVELPASEINNLFQFKDIK